MGWLKRAVFTSAAGVEREERREQRVIRIRTARGVGVEGMGVRYLTKPPGAAIVAG
jgi:hypothetical protein